MIQGPQSQLFENTYKQCFQNCKLAKTDVKLKTYTEEKMEVLGQIQVTVKYQDQVCELPLIVVKGNGFPLFGRNWLKEIRLNWSIIKSVSTELQQLLLRYTDICGDYKVTLILG